VRALRGREWAVAGVAGVFLAGHFASWIASVSLTSVAASVALVSTQPVWVALFAMVALRERPRPQQWLGIVVAVLGAAWIGWGDMEAGPEPLRGDLLALLGALLVAAYYVIGRGLRRRIDLWPYVAVVYGAATLALLVALLATRTPLAAPYTSVDWLVFLALAVGPMMIGHTGQNYALRYLPAYAVNLSLLGEPVGATLIAWMLPGIAEVPTAAALGGGALILGGILLGLRRR
jgi:drug/metabolite transporter (DMT)-like permease